MKNAATGFRPRPNFSDRKRPGTTLQRPAPYLCIQANGQARGGLSLPTRRTVFLIHGGM